MAGSSKMFKWIQAHPRWIRVLLFASGIRAIYVTLEQTLTRNLHANLYPADADSIGIPLSSFIVAHILFAPFFLSVALLPHSTWMTLGPSGRTWIQMLLLLWLGLSYLLVFIAGLGNLAYAADAHSERIGVAVTIFLLLIMTFLTLDIRRLHGSGLLRFGFTR